MNVTPVRGLPRPTVADVADPTQWHDPAMDIIDGYCPATMNALEGAMAGCKAASLRRTSDALADTNGAPTAGTPRLYGLWLPAGLVIAHMTLWAGTTAGATMTHSWTFLADAARNKLAVSNDITTAAWAADTLRTFDIAYTVPSSAWYYWGYVFAGTTMPNTQGIATVATGARAAAPIVAGNSATTGLTTPASAPAAFGALTSLANQAYVEFT